MKRSLLAVLLVSLAAVGFAQTESILIAGDDFPNRFFGAAVAVSFLLEALAG